MHFNFLPGLSYIPNASNWGRLALPSEFPASEKDAKLAQKLGQLQPFLAVFPQECMGQLASFGPT